MSTTERGSSRPQRVVRTVGSSSVDISRLPAWARVPRGKSHDNQRHTETPAAALIEQEVGTFRNAIEQKFGSVEFGSPAVLAMGDFAARTHASVIANDLVRTFNSDEPFTPGDIDDITRATSEEAAIGETVRVREQTVPGYKAAYAFINELSEPSSENIRFIHLDANPESDVDASDSFARRRLATELTNIVDAVIDPTTQDFEITVTSRPQVVDAPDDFDIGPITKISD